MVEVKKLATVINQQDNPNDPKRNDWSGLAKAITWGWDTYGSSYYTRRKVGNKYENNKPQVITAHKFELNIPDEAYITSIKFNVGLRTNRKFYVNTPSAMFCIYGSINPVKYNEKLPNGNGFYNSCYIDANPVPNNRLTDYFRMYTYTLDGANLSKLKLRAKDFNSTIMGVDLRFADANVTGDKEWTGQVDIAVVFATVEYRLPCHKISYKGASTVRTGETFKVDIEYSQECKAYGGVQELDVNVPFGTEIVSYSVDDSSFNPDTKKWTVDGNTWVTGSYSGSKYLHLTLKPYLVGVNELTVSNDKVGRYAYQYNVDTGVDYDYDDIAIGFDSMPHKNHRCCASVSIEGYSNDDTATYTFSNNKTHRVIGWEIAEPTRDVSIASQSGNTVVLNVPTDERFSAYLKCCFVPKSTGSNTLTVSSADTSQSKSLDYTVKSPYKYHISSTAKDNTDSILNHRLATEDIYLTNHRVVTDVDTDNTILNFKSDDVDALMYQTKCGLRFYEWEELDYIGCVPLEHTHFDPKSTYKDTLLDTTYKNKRYMGKKLASDEDITLNVRLHPHQVTTIQGLIDMDKPIPINTNHKSFEGDSLNHRGWVEIYSIKTSYTNPSWYKCDIDVKYLTHNLNTRFNIIKGNKVNTYPVTDMMADVFESGESLSTDETNYFKVDTDGSYYYVDDEDVNPSLRNIFGINNSQYLRVKSRNPLPSINQISFEWNSILMEELKENNISRIIRLCDKDGNSVFEYEYTDFEYLYDNDDTSVDGLNANIVYRVHTTRGWESVNNQITLRTDITSTNSSEETISSDDEDDTENVVETQSELMYGSTLHFKLNNNKLTIIDEGFNGKELYTENAIELMGDEYYWETIWINNNSDGETNNCKSYFNFEVKDTILQSQFSTKMANSIVSPFPVADKNILFVREAQEGTIYYLEDDGEEFSYLIEPYYQYHNGTDLVASNSDGTDSTSIFNLNYGYEIVYMQNGLVRLGFNRLNGQLYLGRYDPTSHTYITTHNLRLSKYDDINIKSITDDKIEIQASDVIFTIWRGHPYIMVNHPTEDILINTKFKRVWAEGVGSDPIDEYPSYWDLMNSSNLLPSCVGGSKEIKSDCLDVTTRTDSNKMTATLNWSNMDWTDIYFDTDKTFTVSGAVSNPSQYIGLDDTKCIFGDLDIRLETDSTIPNSIVAYNHNNPIQVDDTTTLYAKVTDYDGNPVVNKKVRFYERYEPLDLSSIPSSGIVQSGDDITLTAVLKDDDGSRIEGETVEFIEVYTPTSLTVSSDNQVVQSGDTIILKAVLKDADGSRIEGVTVEFYEED